MAGNGWARGRMLRMRVELDGSEPLIWRQLEVDGQVSLDQLHVVLQEAMGWEGGHLHEFRTERKGSKRLDQAVRVPGDQLAYEYDFGDGWRHVLTVEEVRLREPAEPVAVVLDGGRACPPEDVGGIFTYNEVVRALEGQQADADLDEVLEWLPQGFDPARFDVQTANAQLAHRMPARR
jgi:Plasmid pRiA4b ORF-3-like protein